MGLTWRPLRRSSTGLIPLGYPSQTDACWARSSRGLAPWTCRTRGNLFTCASKRCRLEATLGMDSSHVHFFQDCQKCVIPDGRPTLHREEPISFGATPMLDHSSQSSLQWLVYSLFV